MRTYWLIGKAEGNTSCSPQMSVDSSVASGVLGTNKPVGIISPTTTHLITINSPQGNVNSHKTILWEHREQSLLNNNFQTNPLMFNNFKFKEFPETNNNQNDQDPAYTHKRLSDASIKDNYSSCLSLYQGLRKINYDKNSENFNVRKSNEYNSTPIINLLERQPDNFLL